MKSMNWRDRIALLLWRDIDGYDPERGCMGDNHNISIRTRLRGLKQWIQTGWRNHWRFWITTIITTCAAAAAIAPLYTARDVPANKVQSNAGELILNCIKDRNCVIRIEPVSNSQDQIISGSNSAWRDNQGPVKTPAK